MSGQAKKEVTKENSSPSKLLEVKNLTKRFPLKGGFFGKVQGYIHAVEGVSLDVYSGEIVGLVGESGCGKSTLGRTILKLIEPDSGEIFFEGKNITFLDNKAMRPLRKDMQIIFQDPYASLNPRMTIGTAVGEPMLIHDKLSKEERREKVYDLLKRVGLSPEAYDKYPHEFSGGQRQRIGIARALSLNPKLIVADEPVSALDVSIQAQIINLLSDLKKSLGLSLLFIAHDLKVVEHLSQRIMVMYLGKIMETFKSENLSKAKHPYTLSLLSAIPIPDPTVKRKRIILKGDVPSPINPPQGCVFNTRCPMAEDICFKEVPKLRSLAPNHEAACHLV